MTERAALIARKRDFEGVLGVFLRDQPSQINRRKSDAAQLLYLYGKLPAVAVGVQGIVGSLEQQAHAGNDALFQDELRAHQEFLFQRTVTRMQIASAVTMFRNYSGFQLYYSGS